MRKICFSDKGIVNRRFHASWNRFVSISFFLQIIMFVISSFSYRSAGRIPVLCSTCRCRYSWPFNFRIRTVSQISQICFFHLKSNCCKGHTITATLPVFSWKCRIRTAPLRPWCSVLTHYTTFSLNSPNGNRTRASGATVRRTYRYTMKLCFFPVLLLSHYYTYFVLSFYL